MLSWSLQPIYSKTPCMDNWHCNFIKNYCMYMHLNILWWPWVPTRPIQLDVLRCRECILRAKNNDQDAKNVMKMCSEMPTMCSGAENSDQDAEYVFWELSENNALLRMCSLYSTCSMHDGDWGWGLLILVLGTTRWLASVMSPTLMV